MQTRINCHLRQSQAGAERRSRIGMRPECAAGRSAGRSAPAFADRFEPGRGNAGGRGWKEGCAQPETRGNGQPGVPGLVILMEPQCRHVSVQPPCLDRSKRPLQWPDLAEDQRQRFDRFSATASSQLSSPDGRAAIPRAPRKFLLCCPAPANGGAPAFVSGRSIAIEAAMVRARKRKTET